MISLWLSYMITPYLGSAACLESQQAVKRFSSVKLGPKKITSEPIILQLYEYSSEHNVLAKRPSKVAWFTSTRGVWHQI